MRRLGLALLVLLAPLATATASASPPGAIDRHALVTRHHPVLRGFEPGSPLSVGNGELAFAVDATGLQTFADAYDETIPLGTLATAFELAYWRWGLEAAQSWRERLGLAREPGWQRVLDRLSPLPLRGGRYLFAETAPESYDDPRFARDHPSVLGALGMLPGAGVDREAMRRSFDWIWAHWSWPDTWGWDFPLVAMSAARLGQTARAIDALLMDTPKNGYRPNGHNHQRPGLTIYLPGNGGLLAAVAMMAAGWDGGPEAHAPGFPSDGSWSVRFEGLRRMP